MTAKKQPDLAMREALIARAMETFPSKPLSKGHPEYLILSDRRITLPTLPCLREPPLKPIKG